MPKFRVPVEWTMWGHFDVDAEDEDDAIDKALENENGPCTCFPIDGGYLEGSLTVNEMGENIERIG